jgi:hypothetical protein
VPAAVDLRSALAAINALHATIQQLTGQIAAPGPYGLQGLGNGSGGGGFSSTQGNDGPKGDNGKDAKKPKTGRFVEDKSQRVTQTIKVYQNNDKTSENWVKIKTDQQGGVGGHSDR